MVRVTSVLILAAKAPGFRFGARALYRYQAGLDYDKQLRLAAHTQYRLPQV